MDKIVSFGKGIRRQPSIGEDGELSELVNLVPTNGELVNVREMAKVNVVLEEGHTLLCAHNVKGRVNYISKQGNKIYFGVGDASVDVVGFNTASIIGNVVVLFCKGNTIYAVWNGANYDIFSDKAFAFNIDISNTSASINREALTYTSPIGGAELFGMVDNKINEKISTDEKLFKYSTFGFAVLRVLGGEIYSASEMFTLDNIVRDTGMYFENNIAVYGLMKYAATLTYDIPEPIKPLISSIDIYLSQSRHLFIHSNENENQVGFPMTNKEVSKEFADMQFFLSERIRLDEFESGSIVDLKRPLDGAETLEVFPSNVMFSPTISYNYNNSLTIANGDYYTKESANVRSQSVYIGIPEWNDYTGSTGDPSRWVYGYYGKTPDTSYSGKTSDLKPNVKVRYCLEVDVVEDNILNTIRTSGMICYPLPPIFTYPNIYARRARLFLDLTSVGGSYYKREMELTSSSINNYSLYAEHSKTDSLRYIQARNVEENGTSLTYSTADEWTEISESEYVSVADKGDSMALSRIGNNIVKKSVLNNPFVFRDLDTVAIGNGEIKGLSTSAKALSQGQFGQFPLYAFCTDGIWALEVASDGSYSAKQPISRDVCNNPDSITQIDGAVVFTTDQGLKLIQGSEVVLLSGPMDGHNVDERTYFPEGFFAAHKKSESDGLENFDALVVQETRDFRQILATCKIAYDYPNQLLRIFPKEESGKTYKYYVYSFNSREFASVIGEGEVKSIVSGYPSSLLQIGTSIYTFDAAISEGLKRGLLLTRPIDMGEPFALKKLQDMRMHYTKYAEGSKCSMVVYVSNDGVNWFVLPSLRKCSFKYYRIAITTHLSDDDRLSGLIMRYEVERTNKLR
ncbi:MAG: hypothetical protein IKV15_00740 [Bacteroidaceae bacterium]|nr:hypothetical protein [Bacteroidaceae bacterium]